MKETRSDVRDYVLIKTGSPVKRTVRRVQYQAQLLHSATSQPALERSTRRTQLANNCIISQTCCTIPTSILPCSSIPIVHQCPTFHQSHPPLLPSSSLLTPLLHNPLILLQPPHPQLTHPQHRIPHLTPHMLNMPLPPLRLLLHTQRLALRPHNSSPTLE
jgi:hypothetical protein